ncbi:MAG: U32 family peptidase [Sporichthyaceae bacterium]
MRSDMLLAAAGHGPETVPATSAHRFPDGADYRIEVPSVEGPGVLAAVLAEAADRHVVVNRVSQGSGAMMHTEAELAEMARIGADAGLEVSLFVGPREEWGISAMARAADGGCLAGGIRGLRQLRYAVEDVLRAVDCGIRGFLVADLGLLHLLAQAQKTGEVPMDVVWKVSALAAPSNPAALQVLESLGAGTVNLPTDLTLAELAEMRAATALPLDLYVEAPDAMGGVVRGEQVADLVAVAAPLYVKFGLRNSRPLYPSGMHVQHDAELIAREKVRRAQIALEWMARRDADLVQSAPGAAGLAVPRP